MTHSSLEEEWRWVVQILPGLFLLQQLHCIMGAMLVAATYEEFLGGYSLSILPKTVNLQSERLNF